MKLSFLFLLVGLFSTSVQAQGTLTLSATSEFSQGDLNLTENAGSIGGIWFIDGNLFEIGATLTPTQQTIQIGNVASSLTITQNGKVFTYSGNLNGQSLNLVTTYRRLKDKWTFEGTYGAISDLRGRQNDDDLVLLWGTKRFHLDRTRQGECRGQLLENEVVVKTFTCTSTGTLKNAFFENPRHVVAWIISLFVN